jgi:hypothetical protein
LPTSIVARLCPESIVYDRAALPAALDTTAAAMQATHPASVRQRIIRSPTNAIRNLMKRPPAGVCRKLTARVAHSARARFPNRRAQEVGAMTYERSKRFRER